MKKSILKFGILGGVISAFLMSATVPFMHRISYDLGLVIGYAGMVLAFLMVFFGVRSYRDRELGGTIGFWQAVGVGSGIMLITCLFYVLTWEVIYYCFLPDFWDSYGASARAKAMAAGASPAKLAAQAAEIAQYKQMYANPLINAAYTIMEPLPVGIAMTLISALILRRRGKPA
jgi:hypothetical protein